MSITFKLTDDQEHDARLMAETPDLPNFSKAGTGKTHTALRSLQLADQWPAMIAGPLISVDWWREQASEFLNADVQVLTSGEMKFKPGKDVYIMTYGIARNRAAELYSRFNKGRLLMDESQNVRGPDAKQTQAFFGKRLDGHGGLVACFDSAHCLSGTPMEGYANDLWTQTGTLHPSVYARHGIHNYDDFVKSFTFMRMKSFNPRMKAVAKISGNTNEIMLNRIIYQEIGALRRTEAPDLPTLRFRKMKVPITLSREVRRAMDGLTKREILDEFNDPDSVVSKLWRVTGLSKVDHVVPYSGELLRNGPLLIGCWHHDVMDAYVEKIAAMGYSVAKVSGQTKDKVSIRKAFNSGNLDCIVGQMRAMGTSWNLQEACSNVIIAETYPGPAMIEQFYKRVYRFGQTKPCNVDLILSSTNLDSALDDVRERKGLSDVKING